MQGYIAYDLFLTVSTSPPQDLRINSDTTPTVVRLQSDKICVNHVVKLGISTRDCLSGVRLLLTQNGNIRHQRLRIGFSLK